jgi:hypothetical protein
MEFAIGQNVKIKCYEELPEKFRTKGVAKVAGKDAQIVDVVHSTAKGGTFYLARVDGCSRTSGVCFTEECFEIPKEKTYRFEIDDLDKVVVVRMYADDKEIGRAHGHKIHEGDVGVAQAVSYAMRFIYTALNGGKMEVRR